MMLALPELQVQADRLKQCSRCHCQSINNKEFMRSSDGSGWLCPWCKQLVWSNSQWKILRLTIIVGIILLLFWLSLYLIDHWITNLVNYYVPLNIGLFLLIWPFTNLPHALVMLMGTKVFGGKISMMRYGGLPVWYTKDFGALRVVLGQALFFPEFCINWYFPSHRGLGLKTVLLQSSIYLTSLVILGLLTLTAKNISWRTSVALNEIVWSTTAILTLLWFIFGQNQWGQWASLLKNKEKTMMNQWVGGVINQASFLLRQGKHEESIKLCLEALSQYPDSIPLKLHLSYLYGNSNQSEREIQLLSGMNDLSQFTYLHQAVICNNYGWALLKTGNLANAQPFLERAYLLLPWNASVLNSKGWYEVESGHINEGVELLLQSVERADTPESKASSLAFAAIGLFRQQKIKQAIELLQKAENLNPEAQEVLLAKSEMGHAYSPG